MLLLLLLLLLLLGSMNVEDVDDVAEESPSTRANRPLPLRLIRAPSPLLPPLPSVAAPHGPSVAFDDDDTKLHAAGRENDLGRGIPSP